MLRVSSTLLAAGLTVATMAVLELPPRLSFNSLQGKRPSLGFTSTTRISDFSAQHKAARTAPGRAPPRSPEPWSSPALCELLREAVICAQAYTARSGPCRGPRGSAHFQKGTGCLGYLCPALHHGLLEQVDAQYMVNGHESNIVSY